MSSIYFFYLLIFLFSLGQLGRIELASGVALYIQDCALFFLITLWSIRNKGIILNYFIKSRYFIAIFIFTLICLLSLIVNSLSLSVSEFFVSFLYTFRWFLYSLLFIFVSSHNKFTKFNIIKALVISQVLFIIFGFIQYLYYPNLRNLYYLGWDDHLFRLFSTYLDPNYAAAQFNLFIFLLIGLYFTKDLLSIKFKKILLVLLLLSIIALLLTYSRSGYLMFIVGSIVSLWLFEKKKLIFVLFSIFTLGVFFIPKNLGSSGVELWRTASIIARSESALHTLVIIRDKPLIGVGFNSYRYAQKRYGFLDEKTWNSTHSGAGTDNSFLFVIATTGVIGFSSYIYMWYLMLSGSLNTIKTEKDFNMNKSMAIVVLTSIGGIFINALFINSLFYPSIMFWLWILLGLSNHEARVNTKP